VLSVLCWLIFCPSRDECDGDHELI
jgi:hypothetical protein